MFSRNAFTLLALFVVICLSQITPTSSHAANVKCNVFDLLETCKDSVVDVADSGEDKNLEDLREMLVDECEEMSGLLVAKCLMKYLCINHGEKAVDEVRDCVSDVCPLAKRLPQKVCHG